MAVSHASVSLFDQPKGGLTLCPQKSTARPGRPKARRVLFVVGFAHDLVSPIFTSHVVHIMGLVSMCWVHEGCPGEHTSCPPRYAMKLENRHQTQVPPFDLVCSGTAVARLKGFSESRVVGLHLGSSDAITIKIACTNPNTRRDGGYLLVRIYTILGITVRERNPCKKRSTKREK